MDSNLITIREIIHNEGNKPKSGRQSTYHTYPFSITVDISSDCGSIEIVSSLMKKIEHHLLLIAAQGVFPIEFNGKIDIDFTRKERRIREGVGKLLSRKDKRN